MKICDVREICLFWWVFVLFFCSISFAQDGTKSKVSKSNDSAGVVSEINESKDPTLTRAEYITDLEVPKSFYLYMEKKKEFLEKFRPQQDQGSYASISEETKKFYQWETGIRTPIALRILKDDWEQFPESHPAIVEYVKSKIKEHNINIGSDPEKMSLQKLFDAYCDNQNKSISAILVKLSEIEKELGIPDSLKSLAMDPDSFITLRFAYDKYLDVRALAERAEARKLQEAAQIAAYKAIVPVSRDSKEYRDALQAYKDAIAEQELIIEAVNKKDPTWIYSRRLVLSGKVGQSGFPGKQIDEFAASLNEEQKKSFNILV
jgi:hypothetical protein